MWECRHERSQDSILESVEAGHCHDGMDNRARLTLTYSALYTARFISDTLYDAQLIWTTFNIISAVGIVIALVGNFRPHPGADQDLGRPRCLGSAHTPSSMLTSALAIWFFRNWGPPSCPGGEESVSVHSDVIWMVITVLILSS